MKRREKIIRAACRLFAEQGFDGTPTSQIALEASIKEPLIFYHFKGKDQLFTTILSQVFKRLFTKLDALQEDSLGPFEMIERLIAIHFEIVEEMPLETAVAIRACPAKLKNSAHICAEYAHGWRDRLKSQLKQCLEEGIEIGELREMSIPETVNILIALINGLVRQQVYKLDNLCGVKDAAVEFCRRSLIRNESR